ncbi:MAG: phospholipase C [Phenylobacterium sp.]|jgi:phospholipase C
MNKIKHIVYIMMENRSMDNLLGWLYDEQNPPKVNIPAQDPPTYDGLKEKTYFNLDKHGDKHFMVKGTGDNMNVPMHDPHEEYEYVCDQLFGSQTTPVSPQVPTMGGFYQDFAAYDSHTEEIMQSYTPEELPVLNGLARHFAVSDRYFCSVPTQTNCNRAFSHCGNSLGVNDKGQLESWVNNRDFSYVPPHLSQPQGRQFNQKTLWNVLSDNGLGQTSDWMHYYSHGSWLEDIAGSEGYSYTRDLMEQLQGKEFDQHFGKMDTFLEQAKAGTLPSVCFLEPEWGLQKLVLGHDVGINGSDYHPPTNLAPGEAFLKQIYEALTSNEEAWQQTLWIINFDEHGGTYDHVAPPWNAATPWSNGETPTPENAEMGFKFDRFGVRVPLILVSPLVEESSVFRAEGDIPYDHTSVIATILTMMGVDKDKWQLGGRTANAPTFEHLLSRETPRADIPSLQVNQNAVENKALEVPPNDIHQRMAQSLLNRAVKQQGLSGEAVNALALTPLQDAKHPAHLADILDDAVKKVRGS